jgi:hypothetical protein
MAWKKEWGWLGYVGLELGWGFCDLKEVVVGIIYIIMFIHIDEYLLRQVQAKLRLGRPDFFLSNALNADPKCDPAAL